MRPSGKSGCHLPSRPPGGAGAQPKGARARGGGGVRRASASARSEAFPGPAGGARCVPCKARAGVGAPEQRKQKAKAKAAVGAHGGGGVGRVLEPGEGGDRSERVAAAGWALSQARHEWRRRCGPRLRAFGTEERWQRLHFLLHFHPWGEEKEGAIPTTPPPACRKKKAVSSAWGVSVAPAQHVRIGLPSLGRLALQTFHFLCAERPPLTQRRMHVPHSLFIHPPPCSSAPPASCPPPNSPAPPMLAQPDPPPPHPARGAGGCSLSHPQLPPPTPTNTIQAPSQRTSYSRPSDARPECRRACGRGGQSQWI